MCLELRSPRGTRSRTHWVCLSAFAQENVFCIINDEQGWSDLSVSLLKAARLHLLNNYCTLKPLIWCTFGWGWRPLCCTETADLGAGHIPQLQNQNADLSSWFDSSWPSSVKNGFAALPQHLSLNSCWYNVDVLTQVYRNMGNTPYSPEVLTPLLRGVDRLGLLIRCALVFQLAKRKDLHSPGRDRSCEYGLLLPLRNQDGTCRLLLCIPLKASSWWSTSQLSHRTQQLCELIINEWH